METYTTRAAVSTDADVLSDCILALSEETEQHTLDRSLVHSTVVRILAADSREFYIVCEWAGQVVGFVSSHYYLNEWNGQYTYWIRDLYVVPEHRQRGVCRQLLTALQTRAAPSTAFRLMMAKDNAVARQVYSKFGFSENAYCVLETQ